MQANTIQEVITQLDDIISKGIQNEDRGAYFAALYRKVTQEVANKLTQYYFEDPIRMEKLDVVFANRYLFAWEQYLNDQTCSEAWKFAFDSAKSNKPMVLEHLLLGMNAHIGLDLGIAAATIAPGDAIYSLKNDFDKINVVLAELVNGVKTDLYAMWPFSKLFSWMNTSDFENTIAGFSMNIAREAAWKVALEYAFITEEIQKRNYLINRDQQVVAFSQKILFPGNAISKIKSGFRMFEWGSVADKIRLLMD
ncbi:MAG: hypothetical protein IPK91_00070 [Saprospiraceae bacterium]|nr:hypothetical protein [Saprospiraceae bacterium]MBK8295697.1 hypothetical protein [Saprospiraceae bacterium]